ncbi:arsenate reductase ArsC [Aliiglaciecola sp. CAU 1673]|uniref:arsenate reductase ArsC n=1 Tax=Aliiglaciecola sp. CAU 1673 TaxID=3032595 RepID=UPI0023DB0A4A|nr:arsenate reductase ArsC [Aliiglaciecola sp. CAU 1673]MDF2178364.1 arsenate reductase ArsC [Aliiglaciecola sp. CAU 1673]
MKILYICTHNRCRSILSEAVTNHLANGRIQARSAGSQPAGEVHPLTLKYLAEAGINTDGLESQSWDDFADFKPDLVITVCDSAAGESCPLWMGESLKMHWGLADPSKLQGSEEDIAAAFHKVMDEIKSRVKGLLRLDLEHLQRANLKHALQSLGAR